MPKAESLRVELDFQRTCSIDSRLAAGAQRLSKLKCNADVKVEQLSTCSARLLTEKFNTFGSFEKPYSTQAITAKAM